MASTSPSGQTVVQVAQPMHHSASICGCWDCGPSDRNVPFFWASWAASSRRSCSFRYRRTKNSVIVNAMSRPIILFTLIFSHRLGQKAQPQWGSVPNRNRYLEDDRQDKLRQLSRKNGGKGRNTVKLRSASGCLNAPDFVLLKVAFDPCQI